MMSKKRMVYWTGKRARNTTMCHSVRAWGVSTGDGVLFNRVVPHSPCPLTGDRDSKYIAQFEAAFSEMQEHGIVTTDKVPQLIVRSGLDFAEEEMGGCVASLDPEGRGKVERGYFVQWALQNAPLDEEPAEGCVRAWEWEWE